MTTEPPADDLQRPDAADEAQPLADEQVPLPADEDGPAPLPVVPLEAWSPRPAASRTPGPGLLTSLVVIVLALALVAATAFAVKLHREKTLVADTTSQALALIGAGAPPALQSRVSAIQADLAAGRAADASQKLAALRQLLDQPAAAGEGPAPTGEQIPEEAYKDLPPDSATFFRAHEDLFRRFLMLCARAKEMRDAGQNVEALRKARDQVIEAARLGQEEAVKAKLLQMVRQMGGGKDGAGPAGPGGDAPGPLRQKADRVRRAVDRAQSQGKDLRAVYRFMQQAEQAATAGKLDAAGKYLDQALEAVKRAPRMAGRSRRMPAGDAARARLVARERQSRANPLAPFVRALLGVMGAEEENLKDLSDQLLNARGVLFGAKPASDQPELLKPMVDRALAELKTVADRRQELSAQMQAARKPGAAAQPGTALRPGQQRPGQLSPEERRGMMAIVRDRVGQVLDRLRALSDEDYQRDRDTLIRDVLRAVMERPETPRPPTDTTPEQTEHKWPTDQGERIRAKLLKAAPVLQQRQQQGEDMKAVEELFTRARQALYDRELDEAEKLTDEALQQLGLLPKPPAAANP